MSHKLVSIIIPTFNRGHIIGETLDSIISQTYQNCECVIIDDGSTDESLKLLKSYKKLDSRIKYFKRPQTLLKGANSSRNYGFQQSSGEYIIWFDSDDLMTSNHIEKKLETIIKDGLDFVVSCTQNFQNGNLLMPYEYEKKPYGIKAKDFILLKIHWYTYDIMLRRSIAEIITWNEEMKSWQDYNYFCKMLLITEKGEYIESVLTHRRLHENSIQSNLTKNISSFNKEMLDNRYRTYQDIGKKLESEVRNELIFGMMNLCYDLARSHTFSTHFKNTFKVVNESLGRKSAAYFMIALITAFLFKRGFHFLQKAKHR